MSDIVERLRHCADNCGDEYLHELSGRAAEEITRLRAEVERLRAALREIKKKLLVQSCTCSFVVDDIITRTEGGR